MKLRTFLFAALAAVLVEQTALTQPAPGNGGGSSPFPRRLNQVVQQPAALKELLT